MSVRRLTLLFILPVGLLAALVVRQAAAQTAEPPAVPGSPVHPSLALLDAAARKAPQATKGRLCALDEQHGITLEHGDACAQS